MKKTLAFAAIIASASVALSACHPPNENPTDKKVQTASEIAAPTAKVTSTSEAMADAEQVGYAKFVNCAGSPVTLPSKISTDCSDETKYVKGIEWTEINANKAIGEGTLVDGDETTDGVSVILSVPEETSQGLVFTSVKVNGKQIATN